jgi:tetratricopeptide (TPR) repeat protein
VEILGQVWRLAQDTPFTGGGLDAFPGLYSTYILSIPVLFLTHAHNAYLNVLVEQGWLGLAGYAAMLSAGAWAAARRLRRAEADLRWAAAAGALGLTAALVHGVGEGSLVASRAIPVLLIPAGLALAGPEAPPPQAQAGLGARARLLAAGAAALALLAGGLIFWRPLAAAWHANLGALAFGRVDLAGWPTGKWDDGSRAAAYGPAEAELKNAVELQPGNRTANQRLGLAAISRRDFASAADYLEQAYQADPGHRGVNKALAFTYVWLGNYEAAGPLLAGLPEASSELSVYAWWWGTQGRPDLAERAYLMAIRLGS